MDLKSKAEKMKYEEFNLPENKNAFNDAPSKEPTLQASVPTNQQPPSTKKEIQISQQTKERADACKLYIERKYTKIKQDEKEKKEDWESLLKRMENMQLSSSEKEIIKHDIMHKESELLRKKFHHHHLNFNVSSFPLKRRQKLSAKSFESLAIIGRGAFGEVRLCRTRDTSEIVAIKKMKKSEMLLKNQVGHVRAERDVLVNSSIPWIVDLMCSFQDEKYLYLVMEYLPGGDLMTYLMKKDILAEEEAKFYIAECILAVDAVHKMNYIHRDLKPDNILLDANGHIKLSDFGLCKRAEIRPRLDFGKKREADDQIAKLTNLENIKKQQTTFKRNRQLAFSTVGTPDYIAPEVFIQGGYSETVDWWSLGVILFEMLVGYPPFFSEDPSSTCQKILQWKRTFSIPPEAKLSPSAIDLIRRLIADANERLGINGVEEIKAHPFFFGIDWKRLREKKAPYIPEVKSEIDTGNFDKFEEEEPWITEDKQKKGKKANRQQDIDFIGYTFKKDIENQRSHLKQALENLEENMLSQGKKAMVNLADFERRGSDPLIPAPKEEEKQQQSIQPPVEPKLQGNNPFSSENNSFMKMGSKNNLNPNNNALMKEQDKTLIKEKNSVLTITPEKVASQKAIVNNSKLQALFGRSNSPPANPQVQVNPIQNTNALLNKLNLPIKFGNPKEEANTLPNKGIPKAGGPLNQNQTTTKLQDQIKQLQQEHILLQKKQMYQNIPAPNNNINNKPPQINFMVGNKLAGSNNNDPSGLMGAFSSKNMFTDNSGSPRGQVTPNSKQNAVLPDQIKNFKLGNNGSTNKNEIGGLTQNQMNLYQNLLQKKK